MILSVPVPVPLPVSALQKCKRIARITTEYILLLIVTWILNCFAFVPAQRSFVLCLRKFFLVEWVSIYPVKCQCCPHIETSQGTGFYMRATLAFNGLNYFWPLIPFAKPKVRNWLKLTQPAIACSNLTVEMCQRRCSSVLIVNFEGISHFVLVFLLLILSRWMPAGI